MNHLFAALALTKFLLASPFTIGADEPSSKAASKADGVSRFELRDGDRVVLLGSTLIEREQKSGYWETMLTARWPDRNITFRNLGWDGDTVWAESRGLFDAPQVGYQRMLDHVQSLKPTVIVLGYGNNEAFAGKEGLPRFVEQYERLVVDLKRVAADNARLVVLLPIPHEELGPKLPQPLAYNSALEAYVEALYRLAEQREMPVLSPVLDSRTLNRTVGRNVDAPERPKLTINGMHLSERGYQLSAATLLLQLSQASPPRFDCLIALDADGTVVDGTNLSELEVETTSRGLRFLGRRVDLCKPDCQSFFRNLPKGRYTLLIDGDECGTATAAEWGTSRNVSDGPDAEQYERLRRAIIAKNELYYHHWRPQNITYLFGFRKHEQGQNAKEVAEFEKLVAAKEAEIAKLRVPVKQTYELVREHGPK